MLLHRASLYFPLLAGLCSGVNCDCSNLGCFGCKMGQAGRLASWWVRYEYLDGWGLGRESRLVGKLGTSVSLVAVLVDTFVASSCMPLRTPPKRSLETCMECGTCGYLTDPAEGGEVALRGMFRSPYVHVSPPTEPDLLPHSSSRLSPTRHETISRNPKPCDRQQRVLAVLKTGSPQFVGSCTLACLISDEVR